MEWGLSKTAPLHSNRSTSCGQHVEEGVRQGRRRVDQRVSQTFHEDTPDRAALQDQERQLQSIAVPSNLFGNQSQHGRGGLASVSSGVLVVRGFVEHIDRVRQQRASNIFTHSQVRDTETTNDFAHERIVCVSIETAKKICSADLRCRALHRLRLLVDPVQCTSAAPAPVLQ